MLPKMGRVLEMPLLVRRPRPRCTQVCPHCDFTESTNTAPVLEGLHDFLLVAKARIFCNKKLAVHLFLKLFVQQFL